MKSININDFNLKVEQVKKKTKELLLLIFFRSFSVSFLSVLIKNCVYFLWIFLSYNFAVFTVVVVVIVILYLCTVQVTLTLWLMKQAFAQKVLRYPDGGWQLLMETPFAVIFSHVHWPLNCNDMSFGTFIIFWLYELSITIVYLVT